MNTHQELTDELIRDLLVQHKVITKERVKKCGSWMNKKVGIDRHIHSSYKYICNDRECRVCRNKRMNRIRTNHYIQNHSLIAKGGQNTPIDTHYPTFCKRHSKRLI